MDTLTDLSISGRLFVPKPGQTDEQIVSSSVAILRRQVAEEAGHVRRTHGLRLSAGATRRLLKRINPDRLGAFDKEFGHLV